MKNSLKAIFIIIGTTIGAGFASGQEIYSFFNIYKENGILGIFISILITGLITYKGLKIANKYDVSSYNELIAKLKINKKISNIINVIMNIFLLMSFYIMVAGFTAYFKQEFNIPNIVTATIVIILCYITFMKNIEGIAKINSIAIPILILIVIFIGMKANVFGILKNVDIANFKLSTNWIIKAIEYASYNSILVLPILISIRKFAKNKETSISIITSIILFTLSMIIFLIMYSYQEIGTIEMPLVYIASKFGTMYKYIYGIVILFAIYTTMTSAGFSFLQNCSRNKIAYKYLAIFICVSAILISNISFANLVKLTYPVFGVLGILQLCCILAKKY